MKTNLNKNEYYDIFIKFLEENKATYEFADNLWNFSNLSIESYINKMFVEKDYRIENAIIGAFMSIRTKSGSTYWNNLGIKWKKYIKNYTKPTFKSIW